MAEVPAAEAAPEAPTATETADNAASAAAPALPAASDSSAAAAGSGGDASTSAAEAPKASAADVEAVKEHAADLRKEGNELFKVRDLEGAVAKYTEAIKALKAVGEGDAAVFSNRAAVYIAMERYVPACRDAMLAAEYDETFWKAHYRQGLALMAMTPKRFRTQQAIKAFETCLLCETLPAKSRPTIERELAAAQARAAKQEAETPMPENCVIC